jgi:hypothetical protein
MKKLILTRSQLRECLKESDNSTTLQFTAQNNDAVSTISNGQAQQQIAQAKGTFGSDNLTAQITPKTGPGDMTVSIPGTGNSVNGAAEALQNNSVDANKALDNGMNVAVDLGECKTFSKSQLEKERLKMMESKGKVYTKKSLFESFFK